MTMPELAPLPELYHIQLVTQEYKPLVLRFLREIFYEDEPLNSYLYRVQKENVRFLDRGVHAASCVDEGLSLMAITSSGQIIALALNEAVKYGNNPASVAERNPIYPKVKKIVNEIDKQIDRIAELTNASQKEMNLKIMAIHPGWRNKGIGKMLLEKSRGIAKQNGACQIRAACTSAYSAKMFANFGFECLYSLYYEDYRVNGEVVFKPPKPHTAIRAMVLQL